MKTKGLACTCYLAVVYYLAIEFSEYIHYLGLAK